MERLQYVTPSLFLRKRPELPLQDGYGFEVTTIYFFLLIPVGGCSNKNGARADKLRLL